MSVPPSASAVAGLAMLVYGSDQVVDGATALAHRLGVPTLFVGVTFVAVGSSIPEITSSLYAGFYGAGDFIVGHVVGSAVSQVTLGVGVVGLFYPLSMSDSDLDHYGGGMLAAALAMLAAVWSGTVTRLEGAVMVAAYVAFLAVRYEDVAYEDHVDVEEDASLPLAVAAGALGLLLVVAGGHLLVANSRELAVQYGVPSYLVGFVTGLGTTAPEIAIAALAVHRGEASIATGTLFGSNITDPLFSLGVGALVGGFTLADPRAAVVGVTYTVLVSALVVAVFAYQEELSRPAAAGCVLLYVPSLAV
ncbi:MAG: sodium:calcium antiporter [Halobacterium sp.]